MDFETALEHWKGSMYAKINAYLAKQKTGKVPAHYATAIRNLNTNREIPLIVRALKSGMKPLSLSGDYYRADSTKKKRGCQVEGFMSITKNKEDAESFKDAGMIVYKVIVKKGVKGIKTGVEGEILLEDDCFVEYKQEGFFGHTLIVHPPDSEFGYPYCSLERAPNRNKTRRARSSSRNRGSGRRNSNAGI
jgi:hypothetical protein